ncbi:MAG: PHP domain-containing protein, partial [Clostridia bacterium]|nr:PHP domain-containing protein [Clostridia bacterium]
MISDLHLHTTASDGKLSPTEIVRWAKDGGLDVIAVTDHDTVDGIEEAEEEAKRLGIRFVRGIEISAYAVSEVHILGYNIDHKNADFLSALESVKQMRITRNAAIGAKLANLGIKLDMDFEGKGVGRMNIAREMVREGVCHDVNEAFEKYLSVGAKAYCAVRRVTPIEAVKLIESCGGFASVAHPKKYLLDGRLEMLISGLKPHGLKGLEVYYPGHSDKDIAQLLGLCKRYGLLPTGGSD